jgi:hypothetical protein
MPIEWQVMYQSWHFEFEKTDIMKERWLRERTAPATRGEHSISRVIGGRFFAVGCNFFIAVVAGRLVRAPLIAG